MNTLKCITFAGAPGSSKTPISNYLSGELNLPVLNNDAIRTEVTEDLLTFDLAEYDKRQEDRCRTIMQKGNSFIFDASVDRKWDTFQQWLSQYDYDCFVISLDFSSELLRKIYIAKQYENTEVLENYIHQHQDFVTLYSDVIGLHITDETFTKRLDLSLQYTKQWSL